MVIGGGLIANAFREHDTSNILIYAQGVSNSSCVDEEQFARDYRCLCDGIEQARDNLFVYFSTCSLHDDTVAHTPYVIYKRKAEHTIRTRCTNYLIVRIPQIVGRATNTHTLINYLANCIRNGVDFKVWSGTERNVICVDDMVRMSLTAIEAGEHNTTIHVANKHNYVVEKIVSDLEVVMKTSAQYTTIDRPSAYYIPNDGYHIETDDKYLEHTLRKYYGAP